MRKSRERKIKKFLHLYFLLENSKISVVRYPIYIDILLSTVVYSNAVLLYYLSDKLGVKRVNKLSFDLC